MWLIGMMGSGKSTVGELAADRLGVTFHDTDLLVEETAGMSIAELWRTRGEEAFRDVETQVIATVPRAGIAAAGGGAVLRAENRSMIASSDVVIWLRCEVAELARRVRDGGDRPLLANDGSLESTLKRILTERAPIYESLSTQQIETTARSLDEVVSEVIDSWPR